MKKQLNVIFAFLLLAGNVSAKRDFYVSKEIWCGEDERCYLLKGDMPLSGKLRQYHANGQVLSDTDYRDGLRHGVRVIYDDKGNQRSYLLYQNGKLNGMSVSYYPSGNVEYETEFTDGLVNGIHRRYYKDGTLHHEETRTSGQLNGRVREYYPNGKIFLEVIYDNGIIAQAKCRTPDGKTIDFTADKELFQASGKTPCRNQTSEM